MRLITVGGIFWRTDSSGNLTAFDTSGTVLGKFLAGKFAFSGNKGVLVNNSAIFSTTSLAGVDIGQSIQITPQISASIMVFAYLDATSNSIAGDGSQLTIRRSLGTNNPAGGTADGNPILAFCDTTYAAAGSADRRTLSLFAIDTTVTVGQAYTYSLAAAAVTGGTFAWFLGGVANIGAFEL